MPRDLAAALFIAFAQPVLAQQGPYKWDTSWRPEWLSIVPVARSSAAQIKAGVQNADIVIHPLMVAHKALPVPVPRPIMCLDMMVDAMSKVHTDPPYSRRRADEAVECYEGVSAPTQEAQNDPPEVPSPERRRPVYPPPDPIKPPRVPSVDECLKVRLGSADIHPPPALATYVPSRDSIAIILVGDLSGFSGVLNPDVLKELEKFLRIPEGIKGDLLKAILRNNIPHGVPTPWDFFSDVTRDHVTLLGGGPDSLARLVCAYNAEEVEVERTRARVLANKTEGNQKAFDAALNARTIFTDSIIFLRKKYVQAYDNLGPMEQSGYKTPGEMNFPEWAWNNT